MILPGMPSVWRPCALAKTPARTRKHCNFLLSPPRTRTSDNVHFSASLFPLPTHRPPQSCFCLLNTYFAQPSQRPPAFTRILPAHSRLPTPAKPELTASHNLSRPFPAALSAPSAPSCRIYQSFSNPIPRLLRRDNLRPLRPSRTFRTRASPQTRPRQAIVRPFSARAQVTET
jgi:hypothetical protein